MTVLTGAAASAAAADAAAGEARGRTPLAAHLIHSPTAASVASAAPAPAPAPAVGGLQEAQRRPHQHQPASAAAAAATHAAAALLNFSELPSDLAQLHLHPTSKISNDPNFNNTAYSSAQQPQQPSPPSSNPPSSHLHPRKPSPGLAARLKALGFGTARKTSPPPPASHLSQNDRVGRLPEDQLRQLDQKHQAGSAATVIERRGRPWKGAIARIPSVASLKGSSSKPSSPARSRGGGDNYNDDHDDYYYYDGDGDRVDGGKTQGDAYDAPSSSDFLPEIAAPPPLEMDTNKYRLPDHTNGNGTKAQRDTRQLHLERDARRPPSPELPPPPLPKDTPPLGTAPVAPAAVAAPPPPAAAATTTTSQDYIPDAPSYFNPLGLQRPGSIYTLSRASFANQLAQLTSLQLPDAESLSSKVSAIPTAQAAARALIGAADQIRNWISKASEVIEGLDSDDDVEWAAAGGREGVEEVENAILRFEELINVYVSAIEELQTRSDIAQVSPDDLNRAVVQMESILDEWAKMRAALQSVKGQVEIAMEWEELWNMVLGDIQNEMDELSRLVFEMEERRHKSILAVTTGDGVDIGDLETIVEEAPLPPTQGGGPARLQANHRFSLPTFPVSPSSPGPPSAISQDDSSLLALFARMQPLRASLDFLPMRLSVFEARAERCFPTACEELEMRRSGLDGSYKKLEKDAESLRKELGEDRWIMVFRGAGRQAQKMYESVERSVAKVREAVDAGLHLTNQPLMAKKIEGFETKKTHYGPAIERVLSIIDKGVKDRLTVNGEILRLHAEMQTKWEELKDRMREMDLTLEELQDKKGQQLRDSISSMLSNDRSTIGSGNETPQSSPPSSVIMSSLGFDTTAKAATPGGGIMSKRRSSSIGSHLPQPATNRRSVSATGPPVPQVARKPVSRYSTMGSLATTPSRSGSATPVGAPRGGGAAAAAAAASMPPRPASTLGNRPRWNSSTTGVDTGHNFKPLSLTSPSPYAKTPVSARSAGAPSLTPTSSASKLPMLRSPLGRSGSSSPIPEDSPSRPPPASLNSSGSRMSFRERLTSPGPYAQQTLAKPRLATQSSMSALTNRRASLQSPRASDNTTVNPAPRPASSLASSRRSSMLPTPRGKTPQSGRESPQAVAGARSAMRKQNNPVDNKPRWRN